MHAPVPAAGGFDRTAIVQFVLCTLIWGCTWTVIRTQLGEVPPSWSVTWRFLLAGGVLTAWCLMTGRTLAIGRRGHAFALTAGVFQFAINFNLVYRAEQHVASGLVALLFALLLVPNALFGWLFLGHRLSRRFVMGSVMGIAGVALLFAPDFTGPAPDREMLTGLLMAIGAVLSASFANIMQASRQGQALPLEGTLAMSMLYGTALNAGIACALAGPPSIGTTPLYLAGLAYLGIAASAVAFILYFRLIRSVGPAAAAYTGIIIPVLAMALSTLLEGYVWTPTAIAGAALAIAGMIVALRTR